MDSVPSHGCHVANVVMLVQVPGEGSVGPLSRALGHNVFVVHLDLSGLGLGDAGAAAFAKTVRLLIYTSRAS